MTFSKNRLHEVSKLETSSTLQTLTENHQKLTQNDQKLTQKNQMLTQNHQIFLSYFWVFEKKNIANYKI